MSNTHWQNNGVQFSRLLAEIMATQELDLNSLANSMDLSVDEINELFDRANQAWEDSKAGKEPLITVDLNIFDDERNVVDGTTAEMTLGQISDVIDHAAQLVVVRRSARRSSGDTDGILAELEEAVLAAGVVQS